MDNEPLPQTGSAQTPRGAGVGAALAWIVICGLAVLVVVVNQLDVRGLRAGERGERLGLVTFDLQMRYIVGVNASIPGHEEELYAQAPRFVSESPAQQLRFSIVAQELVGPEKALIELQKVQPALADGPAEQPRIERILRRLYEDHAAGSWGAPGVNAEERAWLEEELGWYARLAFHPGGGLAHAKGVPAAVGAAPVAALEQARAEVLEPAITVFITLISGVLVLAALGLGGTVGLIVFLLLVRAGYVTGKVRTGSPGGVYAETFALWLALFVAGTGVLAILPLEGDPLLWGGLAMLGSLVALAWPVFRGIPWRQVRHDIGWSAGRAPVLEPAVGLACYVMALPIVAIGFVLTWLLMTARIEWFGQPVPAHPIIEHAVHGDSAQRLLVFVLASLVAPIVEETMFRGVLHRHLREATRGWRTAWSMVFSGTVTGLIFALLHPPGLPAVPVLMGLAYGFTLAREWRGTLLAGMTAHAVHNALLLLLLIQLLG